MAAKNDSKPRRSRQVKDSSKSGNREGLPTTIADDLRRERDLRVREQAEQLKQFGFYNPSLRKNADLSKWQKEQTRKLWREFGTKIEGAQRDDGAYVALKLSGTKETRKAAKRLLRENATLATEKYAFVERQKSYNVYEAKVKTRKVGKGKRREAEVTIIKAGVDKRGREITRAQKVVGGKAALRKRGEIDKRVRRLKESAQGDRKVMLRFYGNTIGRNIYSSVDSFINSFLNKYQDSLTASEYAQLLDNIEIFEVDRKLSKNEIEAALGEVEGGEVTLPKGFKAKRATVKTYRL